MLNHLLQQTLTVKEIKNWHYCWLGNIYEWAGEERSVNLSKDGFQFAAVPQIAKFLIKANLPVLSAEICYFWP